MHISDLVSVLETNKIHRKLQGRIFVHLVGGICPCQTLRFFFFQQYIGIHIFCPHYFIKFDPTLRKKLCETFCFTYLLFLALLSKFSRSVTEKLYGCYKNNRSVINGCQDMNQDIAHYFAIIEVQHVGMSKKLHIVSS